MSISVNTKKDVFLLSTKNTSYAFGVDDRGLVRHLYWGKKLGSVEELVDEVKNLGMMFGIWVEPEMVNPKAQLYQDHPDWIYHYETRVSDTSRVQYVLNITKPEVREFMYNMLDNLLTRYDIEYIKWDANRPIIQEGDFYRLENPSANRYFLYEYLKEDQGVVFAFLPQSQVGHRSTTLRLRGLEETASYTLHTSAGDVTKSGAYLMYHGVEVKLTGDYASAVVRFEKNK